MNGSHRSAIAWKRDLTVWNIFWMSYRTNRRTTMGKLNVIAEPGKHEILMTRDFNAPRDLVAKALSDPNLVAQWWGPKETTTRVDQMDVRMGGIWRYVQRDN